MRDGRLKERIGTYALPAIALALVGFLAVAFRFYLVPSASMEPMIPTGSRIAAVVVPYGLTHEFSRGDIVVLRSPADLPDVPRGGVLVKRIVALGGDRVLVADGTLYVNGAPSPWQGSTAAVGSASAAVPEGQYYLMGDNRAYSLDSRYFGPVAAEQIYGRVILTYLPGLRTVR